MSDSFFDENGPQGPADSSAASGPTGQPGGRRWRSKVVSLGMLGRGDAVAETADEFTRRARRRRRVKTVALLAFGSVGALSVYSCVALRQQDQQQAEEGWQGADGGQVASQPGAASGTGTGAAGPVATSHSRGPSLWPWMWFMSRGSGFAGRTTTGPVGPTSGFAGGGAGVAGATAGAARSGTAGGRSSSTSSTSRGGFGTIGRALSGSSSS
jgi:hypothetical protein